MAKKAPPQKRVILYDATGARVTDPVWADVQGTGFQLLHDYPGVTPAPGWRVECDGKLYTVDAVHGHALHCTEAAG